MTLPDVTLSKVFWCQPVLPNTRPRFIYQYFSHSICSIFLLFVLFPLICPPSLVHCALARWEDSGAGCSWAGSRVVTQDVPSPPQNTGGGDGTGVVHKSTHHISAHQQHFYFTAQGVRQGFCFDVDTFYYGCRYGTEGYPTRDNKPRPLQHAA